MLLTSGFPGARLSSLDELGFSPRLLNKPYRKQDLAKTLRQGFGARRAWAPPLDFEPGARQAPSPTPLPRDHGE